jgi:hypothetical protein
MPWQGVLGSFLDCCPVFVTIQRPATEVSPAFRGVRSEEQWDIWQRMGGGEKAGLGVAGAAGRSSPVPARRPNLLASDPPAPVVLASSERIG